MSINNPEMYILHHSATTDNKTLSSFDAIKNYHVNTNGWNDIGYHFLIEYVNNKLVFKEGRKPTVNGAHTVGYNTRSIGGCIVGNFDETIPDQEIYDFTAKCIKEKYMDSDGYNLGDLPIKRHSHFAVKTCPGNNFKVTKVEKALSILNGEDIEIESEKLTPYEILKACLDNAEEWQKGHDEIISLAEGDSDLGDLEIFVYFPEFITKLYYANDKINGLSSEEIIDITMSSSEKWINGKRAVIDMGKKNNSLKIFRYFYDLIKKIYYY